MRLEEALKMTKFDSESSKALLNVVYTGAWLVDRFTQQLKPFDVSEQQYNVLRILRGQKGKAVNLQDIQERMVHRMSNATRLVEKLKLKGLVERVVCESNRRKVEISITQKGLDLIGTIQRHLDESETSHKLDSITEEEAVLLNKILEKIRE